MATEVVHAELDGATVRITIDRPDAGNAVNPDVLAGLEAGLDVAEQTPGVRSVVLSGSGGVFCAGADITHTSGLLAAGDVGAAAEFLARAAAMTDRIATLPMPVIAAVDGPAFAGGFEIVLAADIVVATPRARFGDRHVAHGFVPGWHSTARAPRKLGPALAARLLLVGDALPPDQMGTFVSAIVEPDELRATVDALTARMNAAGPVSIATVKRLLGTDEAAAFAREREALVAHLSSAELAEGAAAFRDRRPAAFADRPTVS